MEIIQYLDIKEKALRKNIPIFSTSSKTIQVFNTDTEKYQPLEILSRIDINKQKKIFVITLDIIDDLRKFYNLAVVKYKIHKEHNVIKYVKISGAGKVSYHEIDDMDQLRKMRKLSAKIGFEIMDQVKLVVVVKTIYTQSG